MKNPDKYVRETPRSSLLVWLFNPFHYIAGVAALVVGVVVIAVCSILNAMSNTHFDGVLDFHMGSESAMWLYPAEGLVDWLVMGSLLWVAGKLLSKSEVRFVDVFGTQALARLPMVFPSVIALVPLFREYIERLSSLEKGDVVQPSVIVFALGLAVFAILVMTWMLILMYRAFAVSCNVRGARAVALFIVSVILGETLSKFVIIVLGRLAISS